MDLRERLKGPLHEAFHILSPRIPDLNVGDCHCNLLTEVALDVLAPALAAWLREEAAEQWKRADTHDWEPSRSMAMIRAMWLTDRADAIDPQPERTAL